MRREAGDGVDIQCIDVGSSGGETAGGAAVPWPLGARTGGGGVQGWIMPLVGYY